MKLFKKVDVSAYVVRFWAWSLDSWISVATHIT